MSTDPLSAVRGANQAYYEQITEQEALSCGVAFVCPQYPQLAETNQFREVVIPAGGSMSTAFQEAETFFSSRQLTCYRWVPAMMQPVEPVEAFLVDRGLRPVRNTAMVWTRRAPITAPAGIRILPARAMRSAFRQIGRTDSRHDPAMRDMLMDAANARLDDPQYDTFVALAGGEPAGYGSLYQVGDIGRIKNIFVAESFRRRGVGLAIMAHLLAMSRRLAMPITVLEVTEGGVAAAAFFARCGFEVAGTYMEFHAPG